MSFANKVKGIKQNIRKANSKNTMSQETSQSYLQWKAKRMLIGFLVLMLVLTILSKAADSITIAMVTTQSPKGKTLTFIANGSGTIISNAKKYVKIEDGLGVNRIHVKVGEEVKKGDVLLSIDQKDLNKALETARKESRKLSIQMEEERLGVTDSAIPTKDKAKLSYENAKIDYKESKEELKEEKKNLKEANSQEKKAKKLYDEAMKKSTNEVYEEKLSEYNEAKNAYESVKIANEETLNVAVRALNSANKTLKTLMDKDDKIIENLSNYCTYFSVDNEKAKVSLEELYQLAYEDDSDNYEKHKEDVAALEKKVSRTSEDLKSAKEAYFDHLYLREDITSYEKALESAKRALDDAKEELNYNLKKENKIDLAIKDYMTALSSNDSAKKEGASLSLNRGIYGISGYKKHLEEVEEAKEKLEQVSTDKNTVERKNDNTLKAEEEKINNLNKILDNIANGTYDVKDTATEEKQSLDSAKEEMKTKEQAVKEKDKAVDTAKRAVETAKFDYVKAKEQDGISEETKSKQEELSKLRIQALQLDFEEKKEIVNELTEIQGNKGTMKAPMSGKIDRITFEAGKKSAVDNSIVIDTGRFGILVTVPKEEGEYVSIGDEMELTKKGMKDKITVKVEDIHFTTGKQNSEEGQSLNNTEESEQTEISAIMPKGDYIPGATLSASLKKDSDLYDICIPLSAVRTDEKGDYCLIIESRKSVLGEELIAVRRPLTVVEKDATTAAVEGNLLNQDEVIVSSNKNIIEGDRVRLSQ